MLESIHKSFNNEEIEKVLSNVEVYTNGFYNHNVKTQEISVSHNGRDGKVYVENDIYDG
jgi:hypothetical protein